MPNVTKIEWTATVNPDGTMAPGYSSNPIYAVNRETGKRGHMCVRVSPGCVNCYSRTWNNWRGNGLDYNQQDLAAVEFRLNEKEIKSWRRLPAGCRVFVEDMSDLFGAWVPDAWLDRIFAGMALAPQVTFQLLTKRPERMRDYILSVGQACRDAASRERGFALGRWVDETWGEDATRRLAEVSDAGWWEWQRMPNVWLGTSVEDQKRADERIPLLLQTPAAVRFLSVEPMLGPVSISSAAEEWWESRYRPFWVIAGGESGAGARPCDLAWIRALRDECRANGAEFFLKQLGADPVSTYDGAATRFLPLKDRKGGDEAEWPEDLRIRQFPTAPGAPTP